MASKGVTVIRVIVLSWVMVPHDALVHRLVGGHTVWISRRAHIHMHLHLHERGHLGHGVCQSTRVLHSIAALLGAIGGGH